MDTVPKSIDTIFQGNDSLSIIEIFEEALEKSLENLNISDTGKQNIITPQTFQNNRLNALEIYPLNLFFLVMTEETITELVHVAYDEEFDQIKVSFQSSLFCGIIKIIIPFIGSCHQHTSPFLLTSDFISVLCGGHLNVHCWMFRNVLQSDLLCCLSEAEMSQDFPQVHFNSDTVTLNYRK